MHFVIAIAQRRLARRPLRSTITTQRASWMKSQSSNQHIYCKHITIYLPYILYTQSELGQTSHITIHHIHCKHNINSYLPTIPYTHKASEINQATSTSIASIASAVSTSTYRLFHTHTKQVGSSKPQHPPH